MTDQIEELLARQEDVGEDEDGMDWEETEAALLPRRSGAWEEEEGASEEEIRAAEAVRTGAVGMARPGGRVPGDRSTGGGWEMGRRPLTHMDRDDDVGHGTAEGEETGREGSGIEADDFKALRSVGREIDGGEAVRAAAEDAEVWDGEAEAEEFPWTGALSGTAARWPGGVEERRGETERAAPREDEPRQRAAGTALYDGLRQAAEAARYGRSVRLSPLSGEALGAVSSVQPDLAEWDEIIQRDARRYDGRFALF